MTHELADAAVVSGLPYWRVTVYAGTRVVHLTVPARHGQHAVDVALRSPLVADLEDDIEHAEAVRA